MPAPWSSAGQAAAARASWVEIDTAAILHNLRLVRRLAGEARVYAVCKGGAYGVGAATVARLAADAGIDALACGDPADVRDIRSAGVTLPILAYATTLAEDLPSLGRLATVTAHDAASLGTCLAHGLAFQVELDCGLHRLGFRDGTLATVLAAARAHPTARLEGFYTHLTDLDDDASVTAQMQRFGAMAARIEAAGWRAPRMVASSRVMLRWPSFSLDAVNPGRLVHGLLESPWHEGNDCRPTLAAVKARVIALQELAGQTSSGELAASHPARIAVVPLGFSDGYPRLPAGGSALVRGQRVPIVGMRHAEHCLLDVSAVRGVALGDEVVFLGTQGDERIDMRELAEATGVPLIELVPRLAAIPRRVLL